VVEESLLLVHFVYFVCVIYSNEAPASILHCDIKVGADAEILTSVRDYLLANTFEERSVECGSIDSIENLFKMPI